MINNVGIDFIEQVAIQTSNFSADKGWNSGAAVNVVTKSGTNRFTGSVFETFRDETFDEPNYFAARDPDGNPIKADSISTTTAARSAVRSCATGCSSSVVSR